MRYKGTEKSLPEIARELNVDGVVEGSVLRAGERVRITAQLIHAATDTHLWAESYERDLQDVLTCIRHRTTLAEAGRLLRHVFTALDQPVHQQAVAGVSQQHAQAKADRQQQNHSEKDQKNTDSIVRGAGDHLRTEHIGYDRGTHNSADIENPCDEHR